MDLDNWQGRSKPGDRVVGLTPQYTIGAEGLVLTTEADRAFNMFSLSDG